MSPTIADDGSAVNDSEETPLLKQHKRTPLPVLQIGIGLLLQICEPICSQSIYPYINELVSTLDITGGDERKVGYYAGLIESLFFVTEAITVLQWSRLSDHIGRKPVILVGLMGIMFSILCFGLSRTFVTLVISRSLCGLLNGNIGVMKSLMGELTDPTNRAEAFALIPVTWSMGMSLGPLIGGSLARPSDRFPHAFSAKFWKEFPYFLPCIASASVVFVVSVVTALFLKETVPKRNTQPKRPSSLSPDCALAEALESPSSHEPLPLQKLLVFPVVISILNYTTLALLNISVNALLPLFFHMPLDMGGLDLEPATIGYIIGLYGAGTGLFQFLFFAKLVRRFGPRRIFVTSLSAFIPIFLIFPVVNIVAKKLGVSLLVWVLVGCQLVLLFFMDTAYGCIFMYITASAPNKRSLGATNGLSQTTVSVARAIGPALSTSLFSFSVERNILGGYGVYAFFTVFSALSLLLAVRLPHQIWAEPQELDG